jgi:hypothetical protein
MQDDTGAFGPAGDEPGDGLAAPDFDAPDFDAPDIAAPDFDAPDFPPAEPAAAAAPPLAVPRPDTGELRVDAALSLLDELTELPVTEHPAMFEQVHAQLSEVLDELGARMAPRPPVPPRRDGR